MDVRLEPQLHIVHNAARLFLFESWLGCDSLMLERMVKSLARRPESRWNTSEQWGVPAEKMEVCGKCSLTGQVSKMSAGN